MALFYNHSETFRPVTGVSSVTHTTFKNQVGSSDEIEVKFALMENRLVLTASYYDNELTKQFETNIVQGDTSGQSERTQTAFTKVEGWEMDGRWSPTDNISLLFGMGDYTSKDKAGRETRNAPQGFNYTFFGTYRFNEEPLDGYDFEQMEAAFASARAEKEKPVFLIVNTIIGKYAPHKEGTWKAHGGMLGAEEAAWAAAMRVENRPVALCFTRQGVKSTVSDLTVKRAREGLPRGAYVIFGENGESGDGDVSVLIIATGSEIHPAVGAARILEGKGVSVRVFSMPSWRLSQKPEFCELRYSTPNCKGT